VATSEDKRRTTIRLIALAIIAVAGVAALYLLRPTVPPEELADARTLKPSAFSELAGWSEDDQAPALAAFLQSCERWRPAADDKPLMMAGTVADWRDVCAQAAQIGASDARAFFEAEFQPFAVLNNTEPSGLFTAYFQIEVAGRRAPSGPRHVPLYARPHDLVQVNLGNFREEFTGRSIAGRVEDGRLRPYPVRGAIDNGALADKDLELVWIDNPVDAFFLHIQGSGRVRLPDGDVVRVGYDGTNGHPYSTVGGLMIRRGLLPPGGASMQSIRDWIDANPDEGVALMAENARYVFFRLLDGDEPLGAQGAPLTAGRSLAVDRKYLPLGVPLWLDTTAPGLNGAEPASFRRLMIAQDTGSAITGPVRGDIYWGTGPEAGSVAGRMKYPGRYFVLLPNQVAARFTAVIEQ
jgi:membrane-bound lytic murein transglycosylase A